MTHDEMLILIAELGGWTDENRITASIKHWDEMIVFWQMGEDSHFGLSGPLNGGCACCEDLLCPECIFYKYGRGCAKEGYERAISGLNLKMRRRFLLGRRKILKFLRNVQELLGDKK